MTAIYYRIDDKIVAQMLRPYGNFGIWKLLVRGDRTYNLDRFQYDRW